MVKMKIEGQPLPLHSQGPITGLPPCRLELPSPNSVSPFIWAARACITSELGSNALSGVKAAEEALKVIDERKAENQDY